MPDFTQVSRSHVMAAMQEYDTVGAKDFLRRYGFGRSVAYTLWHNGQEYDSKAILGAAYLHATGTVVKYDEFRGGKDGAAGVLSDLGFDVVIDEQALAAEKPKRVKAARPRKTVDAAPALRVCPTCHMVLPASGVCDFCD